MRAAQNVDYVGESSVSVLLISLDSDMVEVKSRWPYLATTCRAHNEHAETTHRDGYGDVTVAVEGVLSLLP